MKSFEDEVASWVASRASKQTRAAYGHDLRLWVAHCGDSDPGAPSIDTVVAFRDHLQMSRAPLTVRRVLATLSATFAAVRPGLVNPFSERALPRPPGADYRRTEAVSDADARKVIEFAGTRGDAPLRDTALLQVLWSTGMRRVSAVSIRRDGVRHRRGRGAVVAHVVKGGREVESELSAEAESAIAEWLRVAPASMWLFCTVDGKRAMSPENVTRVVAAASHAAGVHVHPHQFRSALITGALDAGIHMERVRAAVHHEDIRSTLRYDQSERGTGVAAEVAAFREKGTGGRER